MDGRIEDLNNKKAEVVDFKSGQQLNERDALKIQRKRDNIDEIEKQRMDALSQGTSLGLVTHMSLARINNAVREATTSAAEKILKKMKDADKDEIEKRAFALLQDTNKNEADLISYLNKIVDTDLEIDAVQPSAAAMAYLVLESIAPQRTIA